MRTPQRVVALANAVIAGGLVVLLAAVAFVVNPPAPPGIAEFAPQASRPITKAPLGQAAGIGFGRGVGAGQTTPRPRVPAGSSTFPLPTATRGVPSAVQCYAWPDGTVTQTFDPQSPPCIANWVDTSGNGGATSAGVNASTIRLAIDQSTYASRQRTYDDLLKFFNSHFQLYGRHFAWAVYTAPSGSTGSPEVQRAAASAAAATKPFGAEAFSSYGQGYYADALAQHHVLTTSTIDMRSAELATDSPYLWNYGPTLDQTLTSLGTFVCTTLAGKPARWATPPQTTGARKFAILLESSPGYQSFDLDPTPLKHRLGACGLSDVITATVNGETTDGSEQTTFAELHGKGVTTVLNLTDGGYSQGLPQRASPQGFTPEWVYCGCSGQYISTYSFSPSDHVFGLAPMDKQQLLTRSMGWLAVQSVDPGFNPIRSIEGIYKRMLLFASGVQEAGPQLTPESVARGLQGTEFPNPGAGSAPYYQARVGFAHGPVMVQDFGVWWFDSSQPNAETGSAGGGMCWAGRGQRWDDAHWPSNIQLFAGACR